jgi:Tol biopolymer transport system component
MRLARAGHAASCPPERREVMQEVVRKMGSRRAIILLGVAMALLFLASGLLPTEPSAQTTSPEGKIVFVRPGTEPSENCFGQPCADIWVMDADGTNQSNLTNTPDTNEGQPAWSPDGTRIAFTGPGALNEDNSGGLGDVYVMDADGTNRTNLTDTPNFLEYRPSWAPSGTQLVFVRELPGQIISEQQDIFVIDANGENANNLTQTDANEDDPAWSPDGAKIAFSGVRNGGEEILTMDPDGNNEEILTGDGSDAFDEAPDWSPDGTKVVFMKQSQELGCCEPWEIWAVNRDGSGDTNLSNHPSDDMGPSWSPDGSEITFTSNRDATEEQPFRTDIYVMPAPTTLPPPSETASVTTSEHSGAMELAASDVLVRAASAQATSQTALRRLTTDGVSTEPDWADSPADTQAPRVTSTSPAAGATGVFATAKVTAIFSEDMMPSSINGQTFKLFRTGSTTKVGASVRYSAGTHKATLNPTNSLRGGATYRAVVTTGAKDLAGNQLDQNSNLSGLQQKVWFFTVRN